MKPVSRLALSAFVALCALTGAQRIASAQLLVGTDTRCQGATLLGPAQATARYNWAIACHNNPPPSSPGHSYAAYQWLTDQSVTDYNAAANASFRDRMYPIYFNFVFGTIWNAPDDATQPCTLRPDAANNAGLCVSGCYLEGTPLQFADGPVGIKSALDHGRTDLVTLTPTATLDNLQFETNKVERYTTDLVPDWQVIFTLTMRSGGSLRVTNEHPLLTSDGVIHQAQGLKVGNELVLASGKPDPIVSIRADKVFTKVYNVKPVTTDYTSNIVVAGGYLNGSVRYQNEFLDAINSLILRRAFTHQAKQF